VTNPADSTTNEYVKVVVPPGVVAISVPAPGSEGSVENPATIPDPILDAGGHCLISQRVLPEITILNTQNAGQSWDFSAQAGPLVLDNTPFPNKWQAVDAQNLGLTVASFTSNLDPNPARGLQPGQPASTTHNVSLYDNPEAQCVLYGAAGNAGLGGGQAHPMVHVANGIGTIKVTGLLNISVPPGTYEGTYTGTIDYTISAGL